MKTQAFRIAASVLLCCAAQADSTNRNPLALISVADIDAVQIARWSVVYQNQFPIPTATHTLEVLVTDPGEIKWLYTNLAALPGPAPVWWTPRG